MLIVSLKANPLKQIDEANIITQQNYLHILKKDAITFKDITINLKWFING